MAVKRAEFEIVSSVKVDPGGMSQLQHMYDLLRKIGLDENGKPIKVDPVPEEAIDRTKEEHEQLHKMHEVVHVLSRNTGELGHLLHYIFSPEAFLVEGAALGIKLLSDRFSELNEKAKAFNELQEQLKTDRIDALAKSLREAKTAAQEFHAEMLKHGNPEDTRSDEEKLKALMSKYGIAGGATFEEQIAHLRAGAAANVARAKGAEEDKSDADQRKVDYAQKAVDDYKKEMHDPKGYVPTGIAEIDEGVEKQLEEEKKHLEDLQDKRQKAIAQRDNDAAAYKSEQANTAAATKEAQEDADQFTKLHTSVAAAKAQPPPPLPDDQRDAIQGDFDQKRHSIAAAGAKYQGNAAALQQLINLDLELHKQYEAKLGEHDEMFMNQARELQAILSRLNSGYGGSAPGS